MSCYRNRSWRWLCRWGRRDTGHSRSLCRWGRRDIGHSRSRKNGGARSRKIQKKNHQAQLLKRLCLRSIRTSTDTEPCLINELLIIGTQFCYTILLYTYSRRILSYSSSTWILLLGPSIYYHVITSKGNNTNYSITLLFLLLASFCLFCSWEALDLEFQNLSCLFHAYSSRT